MYLDNQFKLPPLENLSNCSIFESVNVNIDKILFTKYKYLPKFMESECLSPVLEYLLEKFASIIECRRIDLTNVFNNAWTQKMYVVSLKAS